jgi:hypothetical protein
LADAQEANASSAADTLFHEGTQLYDEARYDLACPKLAESFRLDPATGSLLALAACHEAQGKTASAWAEYGEVVVRARRQGRSDRADAAQQRFSALEPNLSRLTVRLDAGAAKIGGLVVKRDGLALGPESLGAAFPIDPGEHTIEASAPDRRPWSSGVAITAGGASETVVVPVLPEAASPHEAPAMPPASRPPLRSVGIATGAAGVIGLGLGVYFAATAVTRNNDSRADCTGDACGPAGKQARYDALSAGNAATVAFIAGSALLAGGVVLFLVGSQGQQGPSLTASALGDGRGSEVMLAGSF